ncbi:hypothetical protein BO86DRAFT_72459 [Aspergillus japonicus CBS 114.51]|uniref:Uncharacterized protein n=1 Tax=Aspergillus japonicus CBS 114.51 TaxID=1448312 RepID=A0A8T8X3I7_ASPJA|nr:hypothetical protein BO86DRAFT_72459 [Aspergillus japonicus CBS 114.51]RAH82621.1 hypothetical protein BO86DRAFT_72459 [Aspergillus japonicus CBS 114.51]
MRELRGNMAGISATRCHHQTIGTYANPFATDLRGCGRREICVRCYRVEAFVVYLDVDGLTCRGRGVLEWAYPNPNPRDVCYKAPCDYNVVCFNFHDWICSTVCP